MIDGAIGCRASTLELSRPRLVPQIVTYCCPKSYQTMAHGYLKFLVYLNAVRGPPAKPPEMSGWKNDARQTKYRRTQIEEGISPSRGPEMCIQTAAGRCLVSPPK